MKKTAAKKRDFIYFISILLGVVSAVLFFAPIIYVLAHLEMYGGVKEAQISFVSFFAQNGFFILHSFAVLLAFLAFLTAAFTFLAKKSVQITLFFALAMPLIVILAYISGYDKLFQVFYTIM
ncbi:MAG: hypothetical protein LBG21_07245 [Campylobacteraceae bacterium]|jgi:hypothetical protein|nr:hypothetical protein [Campylobacteraceae bacterium]